MRAVTQQSEMRENRGNIKVLDGGDGVCRQECCFQSVRSQMHTDKDFKVTERWKQHTMEK